MNKWKKFSPEVRERAVRMVQEHRGVACAQNRLRAEDAAGVGQVYGDRCRRAASYDHSRDGAHLRSWGARTRNCGVPMRVGLPAPCGPAAQSELRSVTAKRDERLVPHVERVWQANLQV